MKNYRFAVAGLAALSGLAGTLFAAGCGSGGGTSTVADSGMPSLEVLRSAPVSATVGSASLSLSATLTRNLQPTTNATGPLNGMVTITPAAGVEIPAGFTITAAYVVQGTTDGQFTLTTPIVPTTSTVSSVQSTFVGGPALAAGTTASVVVAFTDNKGNPYLLQTPSAVTVGAVF